jgi:hypothetical protein
MKKIITILVCLLAGLYAVNADAKVSSDEDGFEFAFASLKWVLVNPNNPKFIKKKQSVENLYTYMNLVRNNYSSTPEELATWNDTKDVKSGKKYSEDFQYAKNIYNAFSETNEDKIIKDLVFQYSDYENWFGTLPSDQIESDFNEFEKQIKNYAKKKDILTPEEIEDFIYLIYVLDEDTNIKGQVKAKLGLAVSSNKKSTADGVNPAKSQSETDEEVTAAFRKSYEQARQPVQNTIKPNSEVKNTVYADGASFSLEGRYPVSR